MPKRVTLSDVVVEYLKRRKDDAGSQAAIAEKMGVNQQQVSFALRGQREVLVKHLDALLAADRAQPDELLHDLLQVARELRAAR